MRAYVRLTVCLMAAACLTGCSQNAVQENRTISFGADGTAAFQHGAAGVFIDVDGETRSIFKPDEAVLATSSPLWSADKRYVVFTTATAIGSATGRPVTSSMADWNASPGGREFLKRAVHYTCWLYDTQADEDAASKVLFESNCGHAGYVAANLAVRWTPDGTGIAFVAADRNGHHKLRLWDIASKTESKIFPHAVDWLTFEFVPDSAELIVCTEDDTNEGIWIESDADWWHVAQGRGPNQLRTATAELGKLFSFNMTADSPLERLRGLQPVWSVDGQQFAFATHEKIDANNSNFEIHVGSVATKHTRLLKESTEALSDVQWHPNGKQLGFIEYVSHPGYMGSWESSLQLLHVDGTNDVPLSGRSIHQFAGWNTNGSEFAIVSPVNSIPKQDNWAFAMIPARPGREALVVSGSDGEREVFSGTRVTFPHWSPDGKQISFWATFTPSHQSWATLISRNGLPNGDPAATVDLATNEIRWMPVSAIEQLQVGHYYLLKNNPTEALKWYDKASADLPEVTDANRNHLTAAWLYRSICLGRLNRNDEAQTAFDKFIERAMTPLQPMTNVPVPAPNQQAIDGAIMNGYMFLLEVYLSVDAASECQQLLERQIAANKAPAVERLAQQVALSQILLLKDDRTSYLQLISEKLLPTAIQVVGSTTRPLNTMAFDEPVLLGTQLSLLPLLSRDFVSQLDSAALDVAVTRLEALRTEQTAGIAALVLDQILVTAHQVRENPAGEAKVSARLAQNPLSSQINDESLGNVIEAMRRFPAIPMQMGPQPTEAVEPE